MGNRGQGRWKRSRRPPGVYTNSEHPIFRPQEGIFERSRHPLEFARVLTLSDGVFAIALTLLVLSLEIPPRLSSSEFSSELLALTPMVFAFLISTGIIALFWFSHHELFAEIERVDQPIMWLSVAYIGLVVLVPFVQRLLGDYPHEAVAYSLFASVLALLNFLDLVMHWHVYRAGLLRIPWTLSRYHTEIKRGQVLTAGFLVSIPLAFVLLNFTIVIWVLLLPIDRYVKRKGMVGEL